MVICTGVYRMWIALCTALERMADKGRRPICEQRPDMWQDARPDARMDAAEACGFCPAMASCRAFAQANDERFGVWGGHDFTPLARGRAA